MKHLLLILALAGYSQELPSQTAYRAPCYPAEGVSASPGDIVTLYESQLPLADTFKITGEGMEGDAVVVSVDPWECRANLPGFQSGGLIQIDQVVTYPESYMMETGGHTMKFRRDGKVILDGRELGTDQEIFEGLQRLLSGYGECPEAEEN